MLCQESTISFLMDAANKKSHSLMIQGCPGSGKTYLAGQYAKMLCVEDFCIVNPSVSEIRESLDICIKFPHPVVLCIENIDKGNIASAYALLKSLEEPRDDLYIVITCRNIYDVPDTIVSRCLCCATNPPVDSDIEEFSFLVNPSRYLEVKESTLWSCVRNFNEASSVLNMSKSDFEYIESLRSFLPIRDSISNLVWKLGHYEDNRETPIELVIRYIMSFFHTDKHVTMEGFSCIKDIMSGRVASHASVARFLFECKYCE